MSHGAPIKAQKDVLNVGQTSDIRIMVGIQKVDVVWQPTYAENDYQHDKHLDNLKMDRITFIRPEIQYTTSYYLLFLSFG